MKLNRNYSVGLRIHCADRKKVHHGQAKTPSPKAILHGFLSVTVRVLNSYIKSKKRKSFTMKRITSACLSQTIKFEAFTSQEVKAEYDLYLKKLDAKNTKYVIDDFQDNGHGVITVKIRKQYNTYHTGEYLE